MKLSVLIIDAHPVYGIKMEGFLASLAFEEISRITSAKDVLKAITTRSWDILILSAMLPDGDSLDLLKQMRSQGVSAPIIVQTGLLTDKKRCQDFLDAGAQFVLDRREKDWQPLQNAIMSLFVVTPKSIDVR